MSKHLLHATYGYMKIDLCTLRLCSVLRLAVRPHRFLHTHICQQRMSSTQLICGGIGLGSLGPGLLGRRCLKSEEQCKASCAVQHKCCSCGPVAPTVTLGACKSHLTRRPILSGLFSSPPHLPLFPRFLVPFVFIRVTSAEAIFFGIMYAAQLSQGMLQSLAAQFALTARMAKLHVKWRCVCHPPLQYIMLFLLLRSLHSLPSSVPPPYACLAWVGPPIPASVGYPGASSPISKDN